MKKPALRLGIKAGQGSGLWGNAIGKNGDAADGKRLWFPTQVLREQKEKGNRPVSRVLSRTVIHLRRLSPDACSDLPGSRADHTLRSSIWSCSGWGLPCRHCCQRRGALLPHLFILAGSRERKRRRFVFCGTVRRLAPPRRYLAPCPVEPGLSSIPHGDTATVQPVPMGSVPCRAGLGKAGLH